MLPLFLLLQVTQATFTTPIKDIKKEPAQSTGGDLSPLSESLGYAWPHWV